MSLYKDARIYIRRLSPVDFTRHTTISSSELDAMVRAIRARGGQTSRPYRARLPGPIGVLSLLQAIHVLNVSDSAYHNAILVAASDDDATIMRQAVKDLIVQDVQPVSFHQVCRRSEHSGVSYVMPAICPPALTVLLNPTRIEDDLARDFVAKWPGLVIGATVSSPMALNNPPASHFLHPDWHPDPEVPPVSLPRRKNNLAIWLG